ncbi:unnamed protein product [Ostreobium quekettii]|uniref:GUN4-like domain-containing protein n=1 Tax=Ostreobium quekettii TaxID=121088 RepID=A0A8S1JEX1_9CHLO|nr:unnamed protein product [Ostreobium quekettii]|eukprot:evm.model.scf_889EXC.8 EVM.evm.TU.scf_889EXC.8   scf_889EXC:58324-60355(-)
MLSRAIRTGDAAIGAGSPPSDAHHRWLIGQLHGQRNGPRLLARGPLPGARLDESPGVVVRSAGEDSIGTALEGLLGPAPPAGEEASAPDGPEGLDEVELESEAGQDYVKLRELLREGLFREAGDETRARLVEMAGPDAVSRRWVYWSEVKFIPIADMKTIDSLWRAASGGKFGYSAQKEVFLRCQKRWTRFFKEVSWTTGENNNYRQWPGGFDYSLEAPKGHMPLTNCLRGTQLLQALMEHPAFEGIGSASEADLQGGALPDWM